MKNNNFETIIKKIVKEKTHCLFISPHLDDAALSAGGLISYLADHVPVTIVSVFTEVHDGLPTRSAKAFVKQCGFKNARELFTERRKEDKLLFNKIGVKVINLGLFDVLWRKKRNESMITRIMGTVMPEFIHVYPTYRFHGESGKVASNDKKLKTALKKKLLKVIDGNRECVIFCPVGIGGHVDHVITRDVCKSTFDNVIYWSDFNYSLEFTNENNFINKNKLKLAYFNKKLPSKRKLIEGYKSQLNAIFPHGKIPLVSDFFYI